MKLFIQISIAVLFIFGYADLAAQRKQPNILFCISDDQSFTHTGFMGTRELKTPAMDKLAGEGVVFANAYCAAPSCAPSRAAILTGRNAWQMEEGDLLYGALPEKYVVFTSLLKENGYAVGLTGKGYQPANHNLEGFYKEPIGQNYSQIKNEAPEGISTIDYSANFKKFHADKPGDKPFFFWYGSSEPHRPYRQGIGKDAGKNLDNMEVPGFMPNVETVRSDMADYFFEIEWFDKHLGKMVAYLDSIGELENTIIILTADNGMPFPRAKANLYEYGVHLPFVVRWGQSTQGQIVQDYISFTDIAPTILEATGIETPQMMAGKSFLYALHSPASGFIDPSRDQVVAAFERHTISRPDEITFPMRMIRKGDWVYIHNFEPQRWPAGVPEKMENVSGPFGDIDGSPSKTTIIDAKGSTDDLYYYLACEKRPESELYNLHADPFQMNNLAGQKPYAAKQKELKEALFEYLQQNNDPRMAGKSPWDKYPYYGRKNFDAR
ncbi:MAG: sulfatase [Cyclobacteriaceae bacterium]|nr:sulfatase [Cyclobacteriaceae bacterium]